MTLPNLPRIYILTPNVVPYDAIANDVTQMRQVLTRHGYAVRVFAEGIHPECTAIAEPLAGAPAQLWQLPEDILIYHHSMGWPAGEEILFNARNRTIARYHNVTPPAFFARYSRAHQEACTAGIDVARRIAVLPHIMVLGDSTFNCDEMIALGTPAENCRVLPPLHLTEELGQEPFDIPTIQRYSGEGVNLLFVGGIKPNKGHSRAIRTFAAYHHQFNTRSRLIFAGSIDDRLRNYVDELQQLATRLGVSGKVIFTGPVTVSEIKSLYVAADVFLCTSEHEGFCVPLVEAMYFRVPIVAWGTTAVTGTIGACGFVIDEWDEWRLACAIAELVDDPDLATQFGALERRRYLEGFSPSILERKLCDLIAGLVETPSTCYHT